MKHYDIQDVINAEYNLEPLKCRHCKHIGKVTYYYTAKDAHCAVCGEWQLESENKM
jgi:ribosomal protein S27E